MDATLAGGASVEMLLVGVASPFVWATALTKISNPGIFSEFEVTKPAKSKTSSKKRGGKPAKSKQVKKKPAKKAASTEVSEEQKEALRSQVMNTVSAVLGASVGSDEPLMDAGLDSLGSVELRNGLA